jgi:hypothetical protein
VQQDRELEQLKEITGLEDLANLSPKEFARIEKLAAEDQLSREQIASAVPHIPNFYELQKDSIQKLGAVIENAGTSQQTALDVVGKSLDSQFRILEHMAKSTATDETLLKLADITKEVGQDGRQIALAMNRDNNQFWGNVAKGLLAVGAIGGAGALYFATRGKVNLNRPARAIWESREYIEYTEYVNIFRE